MRWKLGIVSPQRLAVYMEGWSVGVGKRRMPWPVVVAALLKARALGWCDLF